jgi:hypothetical protein
LPKGNRQRWLAECAAWRQCYIEARRSVETGLRRPVGGLGRASALNPYTRPRLNGPDRRPRGLGRLCATRAVFSDHERAKAELKALMPEDVKEATGHGVRAKRSKSGAVSFDLLGTEENRAAF